MKCKENLVSTVFTLNSRSYTESVLLLLMVRSFHNHDLFYWTLEQVWSLFGKVFLKFIPYLGFRFQICLTRLLNAVQPKNFYLITRTEDWLTMKAFIWKSSFSFWIWQINVHDLRMLVWSLILGKLSSWQVLTKWILKWTHMLDNFISINKCQLWLRTKQYFSRAGIIIIKVNGKKEGGQRQVCFCCLGYNNFAMNSLKK